MSNPNRIRLSGAFVTKWYEEWKRTGDTMLQQYSGITHGEHHARVERFLEAIQDDLLVELLGEKAVAN
jgi:hypothetical protein